jgi:IS30 family transposase
LGRSHTTVAREVERHSLHLHAAAFGRPETAYKATCAHRSVVTARARPKRANLAMRGRLRTPVLRFLCKRWSPQRSGRAARRPHSADAGAGTRT